jgi:D-methionine transport system ATP-binding protein
MVKTVEDVFRLEQVGLTSPQGLENLLDNISFTVARGECLGIQGRSGSGKTSLLRLLNRLVEASRGKIFYQGQLYQKLPIARLRREVVLVPQEPRLLGMKVEQSLSYPLKLRKMSPAQIGPLLHQAYEEWEIPQTWLERSEQQLSLGQRQWVSLVRGVLLKAPVLLLDEPTSALDPQRAQYLLERLKNLNRSENTTILMVNHQPQWLEAFGDRRLELVQGRLVDEQRPQEKKGDQ